MHFKRSARSDSQLSHKSVNGSLHSLSIADDLVSLSSFNATIPINSGMHRQRGVSTASAYSSVNTSKSPPEPSSTTAGAGSGGSRSVGSIAGPAGSIGRLHPLFPRGSGKLPGSRMVHGVPSRKELQMIRQKNPNVLKNVVYCVVVLEEFMKELSAISIEQTLL